MFPFEPSLAQYLDDPNITNDVGDIREPWTDLAARCQVSEFAAKALFTIGMMRRYIISANVVLRGLRYHGFISAYGLLTSSIELLGRCVHIDRRIRQHPVRHSTERLQAGLEYLKNPRLRSDVIVETNHYVEANGGYSIDDLRNLRNLVIHGACVTTVSSIKGDIELLHQLRKLIYGVPAGENEPHDGPGPLRGALDRYYESLAEGNHDLCEQLASAAISPVPVQLQQGTWPFDAQLVNETRRLVTTNLCQGQFPISGDHTVQDDYFQLYP